MANGLRSGKTGSASPRGLAPAAESRTLKVGGGKEKPRARQPEGAGKRSMHAAQQMRAAAQVLTEAVSNSLAASRAAARSDGASYINE